MRAADTPEAATPVSQAAPAHHYILLSGLPIKHLLITIIIGRDAPASSTAERGA